jgi:CHAT domain-containing protein
MGDIRLMSYLTGATKSRRARTLFLALLLSTLLLASARAQDLSDDADDPSMDEEIAGATEVARSDAPPPRSIDDITQALQRFKPDPRKAEQYRIAAQAAPPATDDKQALFNFYMQRSLAALRIGLLGQRIVDLRLAADAAPGRDHRKQAMRLLGNAEATGGNYLNAIAIEEEAMNDRNARRVVNENCTLALYRAQLGDVEEAKQNLKRCEGALRRRERRDDLRSSEHVLQAHLERARVAVFAAEGRLAEAESAARKSLGEMELFLPTVRGLKQTGAVSNKANLARQRNVRDADERRLAEILMLRGKRIEAEIAARNVLRSLLARTGLYSLATGQALTTLSRIVFEQGRFKDAATLAVAAVDSLEKSGAVPESLPLVEARKTYSAALAAQGRWTDAIAEFEKMAAGIGRDALLAQKYGVGDINWAWALIKTGKADAAIKMLEPMLARMRQRLGERNYPVAELRGFYAVALAANADTARALKEFAAAVPVLLELSRADDASEGGGIARTLRRIQILEGYIALLATLPPAGGNTAGLDSIAESFRLADSARGSGVQRALTASAARAQIGDPQLAQLARQEQDAEQRIATLGDVLNRLLSASPEQQLPKVIGDMRKEIESLQASRVDLKREIQRRFPAYASLVDPAPATISEARAALRAGEALVSIFVGDTTTYVWAVPQQGAPRFATIKIGASEIAATVARLRKALDVGNLDLDSLPKFDVAAAHELFNSLMLPVEAGWKDATSVAIVPHRALGQLPFSLLVTAPAALTAATPQFAEYKTVPWLIRRVAVTQLPAVSTLVTLRHAPPSKAGRQSFIGFGDPLFNKDQLARDVQPAATTRGALRGTVLARAGVNSAELAQLGRLPDTADEIRDIAGLLKANAKSDVFLGVAANERNVKSADLAAHAVIAFATHGLVPGDIDGLDQPALALTAPDVANIDGDGLLTLDEVLALKLDADWVVLSACNTATGEGAGAEAVSGLGRAFFFAGARALLVSNWPVESASARAITTELFRRQAAQPSLTRALALQQAMLSLIDGPGYIDPKSGQSLFSYAHPLFWAPFSLVGDGAGR